MILNFCYITKHFFDIMFQCWHIMRDHVNQSSELGSGTVGIKLSFGQTQLVALRRKIFHYLLLADPPPDIIKVRYKSCFHII